jgi:hypothetical protein
LRFRLRIERRTYVEVCCESAEADRPILSSSSWPASTQGTVRNVLYFVLYVLIKLQESHGKCLQYRKEASPGKMNVQEHAS